MISIFVLKTDLVVELKFYHGACGARYPSKFDVRKNEVGLIRGTLHDRGIHEQQQQQQQRRE